MKKYLLILFTVGLFTGCSKYDDGELWDSVNDLEARLSALEKQCKEMNTNIESMKVIVDVLQSNDYITNVTVISENGVEIGYKIDFHVHPSITIYHGKEGNAGETPYVGENGNWWVGSSDTGVKAEGEDGGQGQTPYVGSNGNWWIGTEDTGVKAKGEDGKNGEDGITPVIGVKQDVDGIYYWTQKIGEAESTWILDSEGNKIKATGEDGQAGETPYIGSNGNWWIGTRDTGVKATGEEGQNGLTPNIGNNGNWWIGTEDTGVKAKGENGITPQLKIENDNWMLSVDNGQSWQNLGRAKGDKGDSFFKSVTNDVNDLTLVLEDGTVIKLPKEQEFSMVLDKEQFSGILAGSSYEINYTITSESERINIETIAPNDWKVGIQKTNNCSGKIIVTTPSVVTDGKILILVSDGKGKTTMRTVTFLKDNFTLDQVEYLIEAIGGVIDVKIQTDMDYNVYVMTEDQMWVSCTSKTQNGFSLKVAVNSNEAYRQAVINIVNNDGIILGEISVTQKSFTIINVTVTGTLSSLISVEKLNQIENVKITGQLGRADYDFLKQAKHLKTLDLSDLNVSIVPVEAFCGSTLQTIILPKNLVTISDRAFAQSNITSISIPETVTEIGHSAFSECKQVRGDLVIPNNVEIIKGWAFSSCTFDGNLILGLHLQEIGSNAFSQCKKLTGNLVMPVNLETIGDEAFKSCDRLSKLTLNENLISIGDYAFEDCVGLEGNLVIPDRVQTIGRGAFVGCTGLGGNDSECVLGTSIISLGRSAFCTMGGKPLNFTRRYFKCCEPPLGVESAIGEEALKYTIYVPVGCQSKYNSIFKGMILEVNF